MKYTVMIRFANRAVKYDTDWTVEASCEAAAKTTALELARKCGYEDKVSYAKCAEFVEESAEAFDRRMELDRMEEYHAS